MGGSGEGGSGSKVSLVCRSVLWTCTISGPLICSRRGLGGSGETFVGFSREHAKLFAAKGTSSVRRTISPHAYALFAFRGARKSRVVRCRTPNNRNATLNQRGRRQGSVELDPRGRATPQFTRPSVRLHLLSDKAAVSREQVRGGGLSHGDTRPPDGGARWARRADPRRLWGHGARGTRTHAELNRLSV